MTQPHSAFTPSTNTAPSTAKSISNPLKTTQDSLSKHDINALANSMGLFTEKLYGKHQPTQLSASFVPYTTSSQSTRTQFNNSPTRKGTENPNSKDKKPGLTISVDNTDLKDILKNYKKVFPQTTKASKTPYSIGLQDKSKKGADVKTKKLSQGDENVRKKSPNRETSKGKIELKQKIVMEEPPKKSSLPQNLALSLNSLYTVGDSNSHRAVVSSRVGESTASKTTVVAENSAKTNKKQPESQKAQEKPKSFGGGLLANLESMSARNVSKISINNINNVGTINNCYMHDNHAASVRAGASHATGPDFETALKEKDEEIQKLMKDKQELQGVLELLVYEINDRKQGKVGSKEKDEAIGGLMVSLIEALSGTEENKEGVIESPGRLIAKRRSQKGNVSQDMENVRTIVNQLKTVSSSPDRSGDKTEYRSELLETLMQNNVKEIKKSNEGKTYDLYQRSFSTTADTTIGKKKESPYGETLKAPSSKKGVKNGTVSSRAKGNGDSLNRKSMNGKEGFVSKGKLYMETLKTQEIDNGLIKTLPSTTTNAAASGGDMLRRKFSHDPKMVSDVISEMLAKKQSVANVENVERKMEKKNEPERLNIKMALDGLKERIAKALGSQKRLQDKIKDSVKVE